LNLNIQNRRVSDHLNLLRGLAALAVLVYHVRYRFFFDFGDVPHPGGFATAFYALTAFGHDAVMAFFVLSGYFISASVIRARRAGKWSWGDYLVNRWTRLSVVLLPGLLLTVFWDRLGLALFPDCPVYSGAPRPWRHDFFPVADRLGAETLAGNAAFLQSILVRPYGSNESLWSLSYEFWYYILFPCAWCALVRPASAGRAAVGLAVFGAVLWAVGRGIALYFPIWLLGVAVGLLPPVPAFRRAYGPAAVAAAVGLYCGLVVFTHTARFKALAGPSVLTADYTTALAFATLLYALFHDTSLRREGAYALAAGALAGCSYTLYVVHLPLLIFVRAALVPDTPWTPDPVHAALGAAVVAACAVYAWGVARMTEAKTDRVRKFVQGRLAAARRWVSARPRALADATADS
jgi:peptidoglycan/LPS O-acetylase OafA/YrhL